MQHAFPVKKTGKARLILKWICNVFLALLLILAVTFHAPWKVTTILAVVFLANTLAPQPIRKWFWRGVLAIVVTLAVWVFLPDKGDWRAYTCEKELAAFEAQFLIPDAQNAAIIYTQLLEAYDSNTYYPDCLDDFDLNELTQTKPFSSKDYPQVAHWLLERQDTIAPLIAACRKDRCHFPLPLYADDPARWNHVAVMRTWARLLVRAANNDLGDDRPDQALAKLERSGIQNVLALRGDPPEGQTVFQKTPGGFEHANELVEHIRAGHDFCLGGAFYPEGHIECRDREQDLLNLKRKVDAGADFLVSQLFLDNGDYFDTVRRARELGINVPMVPGIMPITNVSQVKRFTSMCGVRIPSALLERLEKVDHDPQEVVKVGVEHATAQCKGLLEGGAPGIHFYTLNKSPVTVEIFRNLKALDLV